MNDYGEFDVLAFHAYLDKERQAQGLSWAALARELNRPIAHLPHIRPYSASTFSGMPKRANGTNSYTIMNLLRWLGRTPESFVPGHADSIVGADPYRCPNRSPRLELRCLAQRSPSPTRGAGLHRR